MHGVAEGDCSPTRAPAQPPIGEAVPWSLHPMPEAVSQSAYVERAVTIDDVPLVSTCEAWGPMAMRGGVPWVRGVGARGGRAGGRRGGGGPRGGGGRGGGGPGGGGGAGGGGGGGGAVHGFRR